MSIKKEEKDLADKMFKIGFWSGIGVGLMAGAAIVIVVMALSGLL